MFTADAACASTTAKPFKAYFLQGHGEPSLSDTGDFGYLKFGAHPGAKLHRRDQPGIARRQRRADGLQPAHHRRADHAVVRIRNCKRLTNISTQGGRLFALFNYASIKQPTGLEPILQRWGVNVVAD